MKPNFFYNFEILRKMKNSAVQMAKTVSFKEIFKSKRREAWVFFIGGSLFLMLIFPMRKNADLTDFLKFAFLNGFTFMVFAVGNSILVDYLNEKVSWTENVTKRFVVSIIATIVYTSVAWVFILWIWAFVMSGQLMGIKEWFEALSNNRGSFVMTHIITFSVSSFMHGRTFLLNWRKIAIEAEQLKKEQIAARYDALNNQINPHFLFNSLNVLTTLVHKDADVAEKFVRQLAQNYRYVLETRDQELVPLQTEMRNLEAHIFLLKIRFGESLLPQIDPKLNDLEGKVPPLALQMLIENAVKHNEISKSYPLSIEVFFDEKAQKITVKNTLRRKKNVSDSTGVGLENIKMRYKFLTEKKIDVSENASEFIVSLPMV